MPTPSEQIDARIRQLKGWRGETLVRIRAAIHAAVPEVVESWKWRGVPVWEDHGILCTGESYKDKIKLTLAHGAKLADPAGLFNSSMEGSTRRAIDLFAESVLNAEAFTSLIQAAAEFNRSRKPVRGTTNRQK